MKSWIIGLLCGPLLLMCGCASFELTSMPSADVYENGEKVARTPYHFDMLAGERIFTLKRSGYVEVVVPVSPLDPKRRHYALEWVGRTRIDSLPTGARVLRVSDGEELGITPCALSIARPEQVRIEKKGFGSLEQDLTPNERYVLELKPEGGFESAFYRDIHFVSDQGPVEIHDRVAGEKIGSTPVQLTVLAGSELEYRRAGFKPEMALISKVGSRMVQIELDPITTVTLRGPDGAEVYRAGGSKPIGRVPYTVDVDGDTLFEVRQEGSYPARVAVAPGAASKIDVQLKKIPYKTIVTSPAGAEIYRLGGHEKLGVSPYTAVVDGERIFEIKKAGYKSEVVGLGSDSPKQFRISLKALPKTDPDAAALGELDSPAIGTH